MSAVQINTAHKLDKSIKTIRKSIVESFWQMIFLLRELKCMTGYKSLGYESWDSYLAQEELSLKPITVDKYIITLNHLESLELEYSQYKDIPRSKMRMIAPYLTVKNADDWMHRARSSSWADLREEIQQVELDENGRPEKPILITKYDERSNKWEFVGVKYMDNVHNLPLPLTKLHTYDIT